MKSKEEAIEWMKRCPDPHPDEPACEIELRQVFEASDFQLTPEQRARQDAMAAKITEQRKHPASS